MKQYTGHSAALDFAQPEPVDLSSGKYVKLWQGPQHPGITGNMSLELTLDGDTIIQCKTHVGYLHRGFEKLMEGRNYIQNFTVVCRIAVPEPAFNEYLYAAGLEQLSGIVPPERAQWIRTLNLEMMRLASFMMWIGGMSGAFGLYTVPNWTLAYRDYILDLFEEMTGARIYHMYMVPGGVRFDLPRDFDKRVREV
ncbi:MAG: NADH-quinone oxidoreductase subunit D, partial [Gammaproteobacteria bacterium]